MVELRTHSERIVRQLKRGERMMLSYRGEMLAELVPASSAAIQMSPMDALNRAQELTRGDPHYAQAATNYLRELRADQKAWGERAPA